MKKFVFSLESVRRYREMLATAEAARLEQSRAEARGIERAIEALARSESAWRAEAASGGTGNELTALARTLDHARDERGRLMGQLAGARAKVREREQTAARARRAQETLDRARDRALDAWREAMGREVEAEAAESHLARLVRRRRLELRAAELPADEPGDSA